MAVSNRKLLPNIIDFLFFGPWMRTKFNEKIELSPLAEGAYLRAHIYPPTYMAQRLSI